MAFCDDGKYVWTLRGSHTTRVLAKDELARSKGIDERVAAYFADREESIELPEKQVIEYAPASSAGALIPQLCFCFAQIFIERFWCIGRVTLSSEIDTSPVALYYNRARECAREYQPEPRLLSAQIIHENFFVYCEINIVLIMN